MSIASLGVDSGRTRLKGSSDAQEQHPRTVNETGNKRRGKQSAHEGSSSSKDADDELLPEDGWET